MSNKTDQENFWEGSFGNEYVDRNTSAESIASSISVFSRILSRTGNVRSALELGANIGINLTALQSLLPNALLTAVEINAKAAGILKTNIPKANVFHASILDWEPGQVHDFVFTKGVLIHLPPERLGEVYRKMFDASNKYVLMMEYYNPHPVEVTYRGHSEKLFKRDFAGEFMDSFPSVKLVDYGFVYRRDPNFPQDDATWFLMEKV